MIKRRMKNIINLLRSRFRILLSPEARKDHYDSERFQRTLKKNNQSVFNEMYSDPTLLRLYLGDSRKDFYKIVAQKIASIRKGDEIITSCLDVGCGTGHLLAELRRLGFGGRFVGLDSAEAAGFQVKSHGLDIEFFSGYLSDQSWLDEFDLVLCTEVLEHCEYPASIIEQMLRVTKPGGAVIITVPDGRKDTWEGHIHFWSPESFKLFIEGFGKKASFDYFDDVNFCVIFR